MTLWYAAFGATLACGTLVLLGTDYWSRIRPDVRRAASIGILLTYAIVLYLQPLGLVGSNLLVLAASVAAGALIGSTLREPGAIVAFCVTIALVDFFSFGGGLTRKIIDEYARGENELLRYLAVSVSLDGRIVPVVGVGDLVVLAALYCGLRRVGEPAGVSAFVLLSSLAAALAIGLLVGGAPALPFLAGASIAVVGVSRFRGRGARSSTPEPPTR